MLLSYFAEGSILRNTCIREHNIELALLPLDLCEEAIKIAKVRDVSLYAGHTSSDLFYSRSQLRIAAPRYEDVRAFVHKLLRRRKTDAAIATGNECNLSFKLTHIFLLSFDLFRYDGLRDLSTRLAALNPKSSKVSGPPLCCWS